MFIDQEKCIGCGQCIVYCPVDAIRMRPVEEQGEKAEIDFDECVECSSCLRCSDCPTDAIYQQELEWPRVIRSILSDVLATGDTTGLPGRGTEEGKTNDVTGRFKRRDVGVAIEFGRPVLGARLRDVEKVAEDLASTGVVFETLNPASALMEDASTGKFRGDVLDEKVMSLILEATVKLPKLRDVLECLKVSSGKIDTVFSLDLITRTNEDWSTETEKVVKDAGLWLAPNGKTCVGLGRPLAREE